MPEFLTLLPPNEALQHMLTALPDLPIPPEVVDTQASLGRVITEPITASFPLPSFKRSTVDGYATRAADTFGSNEGLPAYLSIVGEVQMGKAADLEIMPAQCALIHTGGMLPVGADAVIMVEHTQISRKGELEVFRPVAPGENVLQIGEDVSLGDEVIPQGARLGPAEVGGLMALGKTRISVVPQPQFGIISSGDEVVPPDVDLQPGQVHDINSYTLSALIEKNGGIAHRYGIFPDRAEVLQNAAAHALSECDGIVITAGSSASTRDITAQVINRLGKPGVIVHGVNIKPGKPAILAVCNGKPVFGLPGNPVSALVIARLFVIPVLESLLKLRIFPDKKGEQIWPSIQARLLINIASQAGREDWIPVQIVSEKDGYAAEPLFGKSNLIFTLVRADGFICIPPQVTGIAAGDMVDVKFIMD